jgi:putative flippase GtrA
VHRSASTLVLPPRALGPGRGGARATDRTVAGEGLRFAAVGGVATLVSTTAFNLLVHWSLLGPSPHAARPLTAFALANLLGMVVSYTGTRSWAFRDRQPVGVGGGLPAFVAINVASWAVPLTCLAFSRYVLGLDDPSADNLAANGIGLGLGMLVRFWALRRAVFRRPPA